MERTHIRRVLVTALCALLAVSCLWLQAGAADTGESNWIDAADTSWYSSSSDTFTLTSEEELSGLAQLVLDGNDFAGKTILLGEDMNLKGRAWTPIGDHEVRDKVTYEHPFAGTFDGQKHTITGCNFVISDAAGDGLTEYSGFFGCVKDAELKNFTLEQVNMKTNLRVGCVVGYIDAADDAHTTISGVNVSGVAVSTDDYAAAFALKVQGGSATSWNVTMEDCVSDVTVTVTNGSKVGSFVGNNSCGVELVNCVNNGDLTVANSSHSKSEAHAGGLVCYAQGNVKMIDCENHGKVTSNNTRESDGSGNVGGLIATVQSGNSYEFRNCINTGDIVALRANNSGGHFGGLIGRDNNKIPVTIVGCSNTGSISVQGENGKLYAGRLIGYHDNYEDGTKIVTVQDTYSLCDMTVTGNDVTLGNMLGGVEDGYGMDVQSLTLTTDKDLPVVGADADHEPTKDNEGFYVPAKAVGDKTFYGSSIPEDFKGEVWVQNGDGMTQVVAAIDDTYYPDIRSAFSAAQSGNTVRLLADITDTFPNSIFIEKDISWDLNGHFYDTPALICVRRHAAMTVKGPGTVRNLHEDTGIPFVLVGENDTTDSGTNFGWGHLIIQKDVTVEAAKTGINIQPLSLGQARDAVVEIYGTVKGRYYAVNVLGTITQITDECSQIIVHDGAKLVGDEGAGIFLAGYASAVVEGGSVTSNSGSGIEIRAGKLTISGGEVSSAREGELVYNSNESGTTTQGAGLAVTQHTTALPIDVTVQGGVIRGSTGIYENSADGKNPGSVSVHISDGQIIGTEGEAVQTVQTADSPDPFISGGHFSKSVRSHVVPDLAAELYNEVPYQEAPYSYSVSVEEARNSVRENGGQYRGMSEETWHSLYRITGKAVYATVTAPADAFNGDTVEFTVTPESGFAVVGVSVQYSGESSLSPTKEGEKYSFTMPAAVVEISVTCGLTAGEGHPATVIDPPKTETNIAEGITDLNQQDMGGAEVSLPDESLLDVAHDVQNTHDESEARKQLGDKIKDDQQVYIHVVTKVELEVQSYDADGEYVLDITPKYEVIASTAQDAEDVNLGTNAVKLKDSTSFDVTKPAAIVIPVPASFASDGDLVRVTHDHNGKLSRYYAVVTNGKVSFTDKNGFSRFTLIKSKTVQLESLSVAPGSLSPEFDPEVREYQVSVDYEDESADIFPEAGEGCSVSVFFGDRELKKGENGGFTADDLAVGDNIFTVTVTYGDRRETYTVTVTRAAQEQGENGGNSPGGNSPGESSPGGNQGGSHSSGTSTSYPITVNESEHGTVKSSRSRAYSGTNVTLTVTPEDGYVLDSLTVTRKNGRQTEEVEVKEGKTAGTWIFSMPSGAVVVDAVFVRDDTDKPGDEPGGTDSSLPFKDVSADAWYCSFVAEAYERGLMNGVSSTEFAPDAPTTRAMLAVILYRLEGSPDTGTGTASFPDVAEGSWYAEGVNWAADAGVVVGYGDGRFGPNDSITREQMAVMLYRYVRSEGLTSSSEPDDLSRFSDADSVSSWALESMQWAAGSGLIVGINESELDPGAAATRSQMAAILVRFCEKFGL